MRPFNLRERYEIINALAPLLTPEDWKEVCYDLEIWSSAPHLLVRALNRRIPEELSRAWPLAPSLLKELVEICA